MRTFSRYFFFISCLSLVFACEEEKSTRKIQPIEVAVVELKSYGTGNAGKPISYSGSIEANKKVNLSFQVSGTVERIYVKMGELVKEGQLLAKIDETVYRNQYNAAKAQVELARENYNRINEVFQKGSIAEIKMLEAKSSFEQAESSSRALYEKVKFTELHAPFTGYTGTIFLEEGDLGTPAQPALQLLDIDEVKAVIPLPDDEVNMYKTGDTAMVKINALNKITEGVVEEIAVSSSRINPVYSASIKIENPDWRIKPGMACNVYLKENRAKQPYTGSMVLPSHTVSVDEEGNHFIYVADPDENKALRKQVKTGKLYDEGIEITQGVAPGALLITSGYHKLTHGTPVKITKNRQ